MCLSNIIVDISYGAIQGVKLSMACRYGDGHFVAPKDNWHEHRPMCFFVFCNNILEFIVSQ